MDEKFKKLKRQIEGKIERIEQIYGGELDEQDIAKGKILGMKRVLTMIEQL